MLTSGALAGLQELLASYIARDRSKHGHYVNSRVPKMAAYGALISAPLGHFLIKILQKMFSGRTSLKAKILQILVSNLIVRYFPLLSLSRSPFDNVADIANITDRPDPKRRLPDLNGPDRGRADPAPDPRHAARGLHARDEGDVGDVADRAGVCAEVPA